MLAVSGHPQAAAVLSALQGNRLFARVADKALFIKTNDGSFIEAASGKPAPDIMSSGLRQVRMNNAVRGEVEAALGSLRMFAPDAGDPARAAEAVFHSHDPAALPALERALARESDAGVKRRMEQARAAALLFADNTGDADLLAAIEVCVLAATSKPKPACVAVRADAGGDAGRRRAVTAIDRNLQLWSVLQSVYYGLSLGSVLLLAAAGLAITFGVMGVINMAHGEMVMIGAYVTFMVQQFIATWLPSTVRRQSADRHSAGVHRRRTDRHSDRTHADPLAVRQAAGDVARDLGPIPGPATSGALDLRRQQPRRRTRRTG